MVTKEELSLLKLLCRVVLSSTFSNAEDKKQEPLFAEKALFGVSKAEDTYLACDPNAVIIDGYFLLWQTVRNRSLLTINEHSLGL